MNGISLEGMSQRKALQTFKKLKQGLITIKLKTRFLESEKSSTFELNNVFLNKTADAGLGLELIVLIDAQGGYLDGIYIQVNNNNNNNNNNKNNKNMLYG